MVLGNAAATYFVPLMASMQEESTEQIPPQEQHPSTKSPGRKRKVNLGITTRRGVGRNDQPQFH